MEQPATKPEKKEKRAFSTGKRKEAIARVKFTSAKGAAVVNEKAISEYFPGDVAKVEYYKAFTVLDLNPADYTLSLKVVGGGKSSQLEAVSKAIAKALLALNPDYKPKLKKAGLMHRDPRVKERRKYGLAGRARGDKQRPKR